MVVTEYRERKILKRFQVTPVSPAKLLAVEFTIYVLYCAVSLVTLLLASMLFWKAAIPGSLPAFLGSWLLTMVSTLSIGLMVGGIARNAKSGTYPLAADCYLPCSSCIMLHFVEKNPNSIITPNLYIKSNRCNHIKNETHYEQMKKRRKIC